MDHIFNEMLYGGAHMKLVLKHWLTSAEWIHKIYLVSKENAKLVFLKWR